MPTWSYVGLDECGASGMQQSSSRLIVVGAKTDHRHLTVYRGYDWLSKAAEYLHKDQPLPTISDLLHGGLGDFAWMGMSSIEFRRSELECGMIAHIVRALCTDAQHTVVHIDSFGNEQQTTEIVVETLHRRGFSIPYSQVQAHGKGDERMELINYADLLASRIALSLSCDSPYFSTLSSLESELIDLTQLEKLSAHHLFELWDAVGHVWRRPRPYPASFEALRLAA